MSEPFLIAVNARDIEQVLAFMESADAEDALDENDELREATDRLSDQLHAFATNNPEFDE